MTCSACVPPRVAQVAWQVEADVEQKVTAPSTHAWMESYGDFMRFDKERSKTAFTVEKAAVRAKAIAV